MRHKFPVLTVKKLLKSVSIYGSYRKNKTGVPFFLEHPVGLHQANNGTRAGARGGLYSSVRGLTCPRFLVMVLLLSWKYAELNELMSLPVKSNSVNGCVFIEEQWCQISSDVKRGQNLEAARPIPRPRLWGQSQGRGQFLEVEA